MVQTFTSPADPGRPFGSTAPEPVDPLRAAPPADRGVHLDAATAATIAQHLAAATDVAEVAGRAVRCAVDHVIGARWATVTTMTRGVLDTVASTDPAAAAMDRWHTDAGQSPPRAATSGRKTVAQSPDVTTDVQCMMLPAVAGGGPTARAVLTVPLPASPGMEWALNVYADAPDTFTDHSKNTLRLLAVHVSIALNAAHTRTNLQRAIASRDVIGQAKGILMQRYRMDADKAFEALRRVSQSSNHKLLQIAEELALTGDFPSFSSPNDQPAKAPHSDAY